MDDWGGLENRCGACSAVGSNPTLPVCPFRVFDNQNGYVVRPESRADTQVYPYRKRRKCRGEPECSPVVKGGVKGRHPGLPLQETPEM